MYRKKRSVSVKLIKTIIIITIVFASSAAYAFCPVPMGGGVNAQQAFYACLQQEQRQQYKPVDTGPMIDIYG